MKVWILQTGEPINEVDGEVRAGRCNRLALALAQNGVDVTWWTSTFDHFRKCLRNISAEEVTLTTGVKIRFLQTKRGYRRNVSLARYFNQREVAKQFRAISRLARPPDLVLACLPTPELCDAAVEFGANHSLPVIIDVRDLWPDVYLRAIPQWARPILQFALASEFRRVRNSLFRARAITAVSNSYLRWARVRGQRGERTTDRVFPLGSSVPELPEAELRSLQNELTKKLGLSTGLKRIVFSGVFGKFYDLETVICAAKILRENAPFKTEFVFAGSGDKEQALRRRACSCPDIIFSGWLSHKELYALLSMSDIGLSAYTESAPQSLPNKPFDYMAAGLAQVSSLHGELQELLSLHRVGVTYKAGDPHSLATQIIRLGADTSNLTSMGARAKRLFHSQYNSTTIYAQMAQYIDDVARKECYIST